MQHAIKNGGDHHGIGRERPALAAGIRTYPAGRFVIFYQSHPHAVNIVHVFRVAMYIERIFSGGNG